MAKNNEAKISFKKLDSFLDSCQKTNTFGCITGDGQMDITVKAYIPLASMYSLVDSVVENHYGINDNGEEVYQPEVGEVIMRLAIISWYTNLKMEMGADRLASLLFGTELYQQICEYISKEQLDLIYKSVEKRIADKNALIYSEQRKKLEELSAQLDRAVTAFKNLSEAIPADPQKMVDAMMRLSTLNEKELAYAVLEQQPDNVIDLAKRAEKDEH